MIFQLSTTMDLMKPIGYNGKIEANEHTISIKQALSTSLSPVTPASIFVFAACLVLTRSMCRGP
jgi:hypothetical protein